jgi:hypothetical protein
MASRAEQSLSRALQTVLADLPDGADLGESEALRELLVALEYFLPNPVLRATYPEWSRESLDGIIPLLARKTGEGEAELFGACIVISDQSVAPLHVRLRIAAATEEISWLECRLGEWEADGMKRIPYNALHILTDQLYSLGCQPNRIDWFYQATFGRRHPL